MEISDRAALEELRTDIDSIDRDVVSLLSRRADVVARVVELKRDEEAVRSVDRVEQVITRVRGHAESSGIDPDIVEATYRALIGALTEFQLQRLHS